MQIAFHLNFQEIRQFGLCGRGVATMELIVQTTLRLLVARILLGTGRKQHHRREANQCKCYKMFLHNLLIVYYFYRINQGCIFRNAVVVAM